MIRDNHFPAPGQNHIAHAKRVYPLGSEIASGVQIRMDLEAALTALKESLLSSIQPVNVSTTTASLTGIARVFFNNFYSSKPTFIGGKRKELSERPAMQHPIDFTSTLSPIPDTEQLFDMKHATMGGNNVDNLSTNLVVHVGGPSTFLAFGPLDHTNLLLLLKRLSITKIPSLCITKGLAAPEFRNSRTVENSSVGEAKVKAKVIIAGLSRNILTLDHEQQVPIVAISLDLRDPVLQLSQVMLYLRNNKRQPQETIRSRNAQSATFRKHSEVFSGKPDRQRVTKLRDRCLASLLLSSKISLVGSDTLVPGLLKRRSGKFEQRSGFLITGMVKFNRRSEMKIKMERNLDTFTCCACGDELELPAFLCVDGRCWCRSCVRALVRRATEAMEGDDAT